MWGSVGRATVTTHGAVVTAKKAILGYWALVAEKVPHRVKVDTLS